MPSPRSTRRLLHHLLLAPSALAATGVAATLAVGPPVQRLSLATAHVGWVLLASTLVTGPLRVLGGRPNPLSSDLRRDLGIWAALAGLAHAVLGLEVHMGGKLARYFLDPGLGLVPLRHDVFGMANWTGLAAALLLALLLALSSDAALDRLGPARWKAWQRASYALAALVVVHGGLYQWLERRRLALVVLFAATGLAVSALQLAGIRRVRLQRRAGQSRDHAT